MSKESETYRLKMLRHLQDRYGNAKPPEVLEAERVIAEFRKEQADAEKTIPRLESGLPKPDLCPSCWYTGGHEHYLYPIAADDPTRYDRMKCQVCKYEEDREFR